MVDDISVITSELDPKRIVNYCRDLLGIPQLSWSRLREVPFKMDDVTREEKIEWTREVLGKHILPNPHHYPAHLYHELEIFQNLSPDTEDNQEGTPPVFKKINMTHLHFGEWFLADFIYHPSDKPDILHARQKIIRDLDKLDKQKLEGDLRELAQYENDVYWFWKKKDPETRKYLHQLYFDHPILSKCNSSKTTLNLCSFYKILYSPAMMIFSPIICIIAPFIISRYMLKVKINFSEYRQVVLGNMTGGTPGILGVVKKKKKFIVFIQYISIFFWLFSYFQGAYNSVCVAKNTYRVHQSIHYHLSQLGKFLAKSYQMYTDYHHLFDFNYLEEQYNPFIELENSCYSQSCLWANKGTLLIDFLTVTKNKERLLPMFYFVGTLDAYFNIRKLVDTDLFTLADYDFESKTPKLAITDMWHPSFQSSGVIKNSFSLGAAKQKAQNALITGPNAGGKSTFLKSLAISVLFSQTLGIAPGSNFTLTPFYIFNTYLNIPDCKGKESLFEAEMNRAYQHIKNVRDLSANQFSFCIFDEIFNGTNPIEGISGAYAIGDLLGHKKNSISLITTHFHQLSKLSTSHRSSNYNNYQFPVQITKDGDIKYLYKIKPGVSNQLIALKLLSKKGFDPETVQLAEKTCKQLSNSKNADKKRKI